jgi:hypothetical protein
MFTTVRVGKYSRPSAFAIVQWIGFILVWFVFFVVNDYLGMVDKKNEPRKARNTRKVVRRGQILMSPGGVA